jgi:hypothetical protein
VPEEGCSDSIQLGDVGEADRAVAQPAGPPMRAGLLNRLKRLEITQGVGEGCNAPKIEFAYLCSYAVAFCFMAFRAPR